MFNRRDFLKQTMAAGLFSTVCCSVKDKNIEKPNIVFVFTDEQPFYMWSGAGEPVIKTPNLQRLAARGVTFTNCVSNNPICVPYRASLFSAQFGHQNGVRWNTMDPIMSPDIASWPKIMGRNGYTMGYVGKWHLYPGAGNGEKVPPEYRYGFDDYWANSFNYKYRYETKYYDESGQVVTMDDYAPKAQMDQTLGFIEKNKDNPFCVVLSWHPPHPPYEEAPEKWNEYYAKQEIEFRPNVPAEQRTDRLKKQIRGAYAHVSAMDEEIGRLMDRLETLNLADNTVVVFTSDHGDLLQSHGEKWKRWPWDESIKVPFIISCPARINGGRRVESVLSTIDIGPTLLGLAGLKPADEMPGFDYTPILEGKTANPPKSAFIMYYYPPGGNYMTEKVPQLVDYRGVRTEQYTYTKRRDDNVVRPWLLYDNVKDPYQLKNLVDDPAYQDVLQDCEKELQYWLDLVGEEFGA